MKGIGSLVKQQGSRYRISCSSSHIHSINATLKHLYGKLFLGLTLFLILTQGCGHSHSELDHTTIVPITINAQKQMLSNEAMQGLIYSINSDKHGLFIPENQRLISRLIAKRDCAEDLDIDYKEFENNHLILSYVVWREHFCQRPSDRTQVAAWLTQTEALISAQKEREVKAWMREQWIEEITSNAIFRSRQLSPGLLSLLSQAYETEAPQTAAQTRAIWLIYLAYLAEHNEDPQGSILPGIQDLKKYVMIHHPSQKTKDAFKVFFETTYSPDTKQLKPDEQWTYAQSLFQFGELEQSLALSLQLSSATPPKKGKKSKSAVAPNIQKAARELVPKILIARNEPQKAREWDIQRTEEIIRETTPTPPSPTTEQQPDLMTMLMNQPDASIQKNAERIYDYARRLWGNNHTHKALEAIAFMRSKDLTQLSREMQRKFLFLEAKLHLEMNDFTSALRNFDTLVDDDTKFNMDLWWERSLAHMLNGNWSTAYKHLNKMNSKEVDVGTRAQLLFWMAESAKQENDESDMEEALEELLSLPIFSFYQEYAFIHFPHLAKQRVSHNTKTYPTQAPVFISHPMKHVAFQSQAKPEHTDSFMTLLFLDRDLADSYLRTLPQNQVPPEWWSAVSRHYLSVPRYNSFLKEWASAGDPLPPQFRNMYFPLEYWDLIQRKSGAYQIDPLIIIALMRQESLFRKEAVSTAKAFGLTQLLPSTARESLGLIQKHSPLSQRAFYSELLFEPEWSVELGVIFIKRMLEQFQGNWIATIGAYNAGPQAMNHWVKTRSVPQPLLFIERIPYSETRTYIKLVLRNYMVYADMLGLPRLPVTLSTPVLRADATEPVVDDASVGSSLTGL